MGRRDADTRTGRPMSTSNTPRSTPPSSSTPIIDNNALAASLRAPKLGGMQHHHVHARASAPPYLRVAGDDLDPDYRQWLGAHRPRQPCRSGRGPVGFSGR